ncbi:Serpin (serine protease inhibitor) [Corynebacterium mustelae]|uniref:Serpin (Serine protease inhibitor) n=1 Tax=Corynebacterium mustelae TaxID=571915 RepID=A0A0G3GYB3_9CORY|nr:serpin family protein [Corynebacterium mustelae]AKK05550.1 Serpin (serine protease inhibitor) [Corynebacterium mustelae]
MKSPIDLYQLGCRILQSGSANSVVSPVGAAVSYAANTAERNLAEYLSMWRRWAGTPTTQPENQPVVTISTRIVHVPEIKVPDFGHIPEVEVAAGEITQEDLDRWVQKASAGLIMQSAIKPTSNLEKVVQNVVMFAATWQYPFQAANTSVEDFTTATGDVIPTPMMRSDYALIPALKNPRWQSVRLNYSDTGLAAFILMPQTFEPVTAQELLEAVAEVNITEETRVDLHLPKLELESASDCSMLFDGSTDLVHQATQQAMLRVDEEGTVAGIVTEVAIASMLRDPVERFSFDRPFYVVIADTSGLYPLVIGYVANPAG